MGIDKLTKTVQNFHCVHLYLKQKRYNQLLKSSQPYQFYFCIFLILWMQVSIFEVHIFLLLLTSLLFFSKKVTSSFLGLLAPFLIILGIGIVSYFFKLTLLYDFIKDLLYFLKPVLAITAGYFIAKRINSYKGILNNIIIISTIFAIIHLVKIGVYLGFDFVSINEIRRIGGLSNFFEMFALMILITEKKNKSYKIKPKLLKQIAFILISISFVLYFSRNMLVSILIFVLAFNGSLKLSKKGIKYGFLSLLFFGIFYTYLSLNEFQRDKGGIDSFLYKLKIAPSEIFNFNTKVDRNNDAELWDHWRAYEAGRAIDQMVGIPSYLFGNGFGALVDLKFSAPLAGENMRYIPILHNGYVYVFFKTGFLGLFLLFFILVYLYRIGYQKTHHYDLKIINNIIGGFGVYYLFTNLIVTGVYNPVEPSSILLGVLFFYKGKFSKQVLALEVNEKDLKE